MKREFLKDLGLEGDVIDKIMDENGKDINGLKNQLSELDTIKEQVSERDKQIESLKKQSEGNDNLKNQLADLQKAVKTKDQELTNTLNETKRNYEIQIALEKSGARNTKAVSVLLDDEKITFDDKGQLVGLEDQLKKIQEENDFLFQQQANDQNKRNVTFVGNANPIQSDAPEGLVQNALKRHGYSEK